MLLKRLFDLAVSFFLLMLLAGPLALIWLISAVDTASSGIFLQIRIGQFAKPFMILKFRSMHKETGAISGFGRFSRRWKLDEVPQLINVLIGDMSLVGPRPDVPGYYDTLSGEDLEILSVKPGITSEAALLFSREEGLLKSQSDPKKYNDEVLFPKKVSMNLAYARNRSFAGDFKILLKTFLNFVFSKESNGNTL